MNLKVVVGVVAGLVVLGGLGLVVTRKSQGEKNSGVESQMPVVGVTEVPTTAEMEVVEEKEMGQVKEFTVDGSNFKFVPVEMKVKKGDTVRVVFKNVGGFHDFVVDEFDVKTSQIGEGEEEEVEFVASKTGTFEYYCSVGQHRKNGMVGKLIVE